jgi:predicted transcriptional regulator
MDEKTRLNLSLAQDLDDALSNLAEKTKMSKNSLINLALSKLLVEFGVLDLHKETNEKTEILKSTEYCDLLKQGRLVDGETISTIERINVKATGGDEIRFAYYKFNKNNNERLILRPLDINENELLMLFADAVDKKVFTPDFQRKLKAIL